jgi:hypothetical protein
MTTTTTTAALGACAAAFTLAACGSSDPASPADAQAKAEQAQLKFARCMREHGVNVPDPKPDSRGPGLVRVGEGVSPQVMRRADEACRKYMEAAAPKLSAAQQAELRDQAFKFARCMRQHGIDMPDPQVNGGAVRIQIRGARKSSINPESPAFNAAQEACKAFQPKLRAEQSK